MDGKMSQLASEVAEHYGYSDISTFRGMWPIQPSVLEKIKLLPEVLDETKKFRVIIDYDPEWSMNVTFRRMTQAEAELMKAHRPTKDELDKIQMTMKEDENND